MHSSLRSSAWQFVWWSLGISSVLAAPSSVSLNGSPYEVDNIIARDVVIIGGGSTGTYSAIRLSDLGKSVAVVEHKGRLGGHTETYTDPATGKTIDIGVVVFHNLDLVKNYFARLNVSLVTETGLGSSAGSEFVDFRTGKVVANFTSPDFTAALGVYATQLAKYPYVELGFDLPYPVPGDLLLPFGDFVIKYSIQSFIPFLFNFAQGLGDLLAQSTLYVFKNFGSDLITDLSIGFLTTALADNSLLYEHATAVLGENVLLNSTIIAVDRSGSSAKVLLETPSGLTLVKASKLVFTIPPKIDNLGGWDLSVSEKILFPQFDNSAYYTGLLRNTGIPDSTTVSNTGSNTLYNLPVLPASYSFSPTTVSGLTSVKFGSAFALSDEEVQKSIIEEVNRLDFPGKVPGNPEFAVYSSHTPFELTVPAKAIAAGFYKDLYALQGQRHTFYTGAAFHTHDSSLLWNFTERLIPRIVAS
ncbi:hypothetical protein B7494_g715 [Chlorociboria aeruginascens]|nr:hypothetical protein B7494_g715 [Chlorociboria aeruginascens]